ncbi:hypothetical protein C0995_001625 [Termitomyces sp. Mi166|nr:hypothetical protein C0995_001625 [Termitomyces sp. Mi166\
MSDALSEDLARAIISLGHDFCSRYGFMEAVETLLLSSIAQVFLALRVFALLEKLKLVFYLSGMILFAQWVIILYAVSQSSGGIYTPALLLAHDLTQTLPLLPNADPYHNVFPLRFRVPLAETFLCLCLAFDGLVFIGIVYGASKRARQIRTHRSVPLLHIIKRDGILYFFLGLKFIHNQPAMVYVVAS